MVLAAEEWMDRPSAWASRSHFEEDNGLEIQPLFMFKDNWDECSCETGRSEYAEPYGQLDDYYSDIIEYVYCPLKVDWFRADWREGRELTEEQATRWALHHRDAHTAHHIFNGPAKEETKRATLSQARTVSVDGVDISEWITGNIDIGPLADWQQQRLAELPSATVTVSWTPAEDGCTFDGGVITASDGRNRASVVVANRDMEEPGRQDALVRRVCEELDRISGRGGRESGGTDRRGPQEGGAAQ